MNFLQQKIDNAESFIPKLKVLIDIAKNHMYDPTLLADLEDAMVKITDMDEAVVAPLVGKTLFHLHVNCPPVEVLEKLLVMFPTALNVRNSDGLFPIQFAIKDEQNVKRYYDYMHLFVNKDCIGQLHQIRQGDEKTTLENLVSLMTIQMDNTFIDKCLQKVINHFCKMNFIVKEDISKYRLLDLSCNVNCQGRYIVLAVYYREEMKNQTFLMKMLCSNHAFDLNSMKIFLTVSFDLFPEESGLIFFGDRLGLENHISFYSTSSARFLFFEALEPILYQNRFPLLQQICKRHDCNDLLSIFEDRFPFLRNHYDDEDGRSYHQALFAYCPSELLFRTHLSPRIRLDSISFEELETKDPVTRLLPFMTIATHGSVACIYKVLLKHPTAFLNCIKSCTGQKGGPMTLKRKRDNTY